MSTILSTRLRDLRENLNMTQVEVAKSLQCSCRSLSNYELGKREPDLETVLRICDLFDVTADYLLGRTSIPKYYKEIKLDQQADRLLTYYEKLPRQQQNDVVRYARLNLLDLDTKNK